MTWVPRLQTHQSKIVSEGCFDREFCAVPNASECLRRLMKLKSTITLLKVKKLTKTGETTPQKKTKTVLSGNKIMAW